MSGPLAKTASVSQRGLFILAFLTILLDGFDTTSISYVVPTLAQQWGLTPAAFTPVFVTTSLGAVLGYLLSGACVRRAGIRLTMVASVLLFAVGSMATTMAGSVTGLALLRLVTGVGLGLVLPAAIHLAASVAAPGRREAASIAVAAGLSFGATLGGLFGGKMIAAFGWQSVFWLGGLLPLLLVPFIWRCVPAGRADATQTSPRQPGNAASAGMKTVLADGMATRTLLLWAFTFAIFLTIYSLNFWMPTLLLGMGFQASESGLGIAAIGVGGVVGSALLIPLSARYGSARVLLCLSLVAIAALVSLAVLSQFGPSRTSLLLLIGLAGLGLGAGATGQVGLAVSLYPATQRTTGVGLATALGRVGSIVGPAAGGALLAAGAPASTILAVACLPVLVAIVATSALSVLARPREKLEHP